MESTQPSSLRNQYFIISEEFCNTCEYRILKVTFYPTFIKETSSSLPASVGKFIFVCLPKEGVISEVLVILRKVILQIYDRIVN